MVAFLRVLLRLVLVLLLALAPAVGVRPAWAESPASALARDGGQLFANHCAGCHVHGGNIIRRGKTLQLAALQRQGITGPEAIAAIAANGVGQMGGYAGVLGEGGAEAVAEWVWQQAQEGWPRG